jgi:hypothetical protein
MNRRDFVTSAMAIAFAPVDLRAQGQGRASPRIQLGVGASLGGSRPFPEDSPWNQVISQMPVDPNSAALIASIGSSVPLHPDFGYGPRAGRIGIPYVVVSGNQSKVPVRFEYADESDSGPYPIPPDAPIEGGSNSKGDRHVIVIDRDNWKLYELFQAHQSDKGWSAVSGAIFDLNSNELRPQYWTSADAAGLPVFAGLVRADEVFEQKEIRHALRFTCQRTRRAFVHPARHFASQHREPDLPPMGMRVRLKADFDHSRFSSEVQVILKALKHYGMFLADNGGNWYVTGAPDPRWNDVRLRELKRIKGSDLEVVRMGKIITRKGEEAMPARKAFTGD